MAASRLFSLLYLLLDRGQMTAPALARELEVSVRTIYRDVDALSAAGIPIYATRGRGGGVALMERYVLDRTVLTEEEQARLLTALRTFPESEDTREILTKLSGLFRRPGEDWIQVELSPWRRAGDHEARFEFFRNAILGHRVLRLTYLGSYGGTSCRRVIPARLVFKGRAWYLQGWCLEKNAYRTFRLSRVLESEDTGESRMLPMPPPDIEAGFGVLPGSPIVLRFSPAMAYRVYDEFDLADITRESDGALRVSACLPADGWLCGYLLSFGVGVEVLSPAYLREQLAILAREIYQAHGKPDSYCQDYLGILDPSLRKERPMMDPKEMKFCQSCGMPMTEEHIHGTEEDGTRSKDYCSYCYQGGKFVSEMTMEEMIDFCAKPMAASNPGMTEEQAKAQMRQFFPMLLRWKK